jgi:hypothetical protein
MSEIKINNIPVITENNGSVSVDTNSIKVNNAEVIDNLGNLTLPPTGTINTDNNLILSTNNTERMRIDSSGNVIFNSSLTNNTYIKGGGYYTFAANGSTLNIQPTTAYTALILVYDPGGGSGAAFLSTYQNSVVKIAGDSSWYDSDTAGGFCVFKSSYSHNNVTVKNDSIYIRNFYITVISTG